MQGELILPTCSEVSVSPPGYFFVSAEEPAVSCHTPASYGYGSPDGFHRSLQLCGFFVFFVFFCFFATVVLDKCYYQKTNAFTFIYFMVSSQEQQKHLIFWHDVSTII